MTNKVREIKKLNIHHQTRVGANRCHCLTGKSASSPDCLIPDVIAAIHIAASLLALIEYWLAEGMPYSVAQMVKIYGKLINGATATAVQTAES